MSKNTNIIIEEELLASLDIEVAEDKAATFTQVKNAPSFTYEEEVSVADLLACMEESRAACTLEVSELQLA